MPRESSGLVEVLREELADSPLSYAALAMQAGVDPRQIGRFVAGERDLTLATAAKLCEVLGLELKPALRPKGRPKKKP